MPSSGFEPAIPAIERPQTYALDRSATLYGIAACSRQTFYVPQQVTRLNTLQSTQFPPDKTLRVIIRLCN